MTGSPTWIFNGTDAAFAWWHHPQQHLRAAVVLFDTAGYEGMCVHWAMGRLASALARAGFGVLRVDLLGTGDSSDLKDGDVVAGWRRTVPLAVAEARRLAGPVPLVLGGIRLGATVAARWAADHEPCAAAVLLDPVVQGKTWLREQKALAMTSSVGIGANAVDDEGGGAISVLGYHLSAADQADLKALDLRSVQRSPAAEILYLARSDRGADNRWVGALQKLGSRVRTVVSPQLPALLQDAVSSVEPTDDFAHIERWLTERFPSTGSPPPQGRLEPRCEGPGYAEEAVLLGGAKRVAAVGCFPASGAPRSAALVLLNTGANHRVGSHRLSVSTMRALAAQGIASVRVDVGGIGDSPPRAGQKQNFPYNAENLEDVRLAFDWLQQKGCRHFVTTGICSGGHNAFHVAVADSRVRGVVATNTQRWALTQSTDVDLSIRRSGRATEYYQQRMWDPQTYLRLVRGELHLKTLVPLLATRVYERAKARAVGRLTRWAGTQFERDPVARGFMQLFERGVHVAVVVSSDDGARDELAKHLGASFERIGGPGRLVVDVLDGADHTLTQTWAQQRLFSILQTALSNAEGKT